MTFETRRLGQPRQDILAHRSLWYRPSRRERGWSLHDADIPIEVASEHRGHVSNIVIARNNVIFHAQLVGISIGGFSSKVGGTDHCTIVNNTLWADGTQRGASGELQIQYNATNNVIENNIMYAGPTNVLIDDFTSSTPNPAVLNPNLYFASLGAPNSSWDWQGKFFTRYSNYPP